MPNRFYRPELDAVRLTAFLAIFFHHAVPTGDHPTRLGQWMLACGSGLPLFFTLSAYLITLLLLQECHKTGTVDLPRFYKRRALRIWPLYFGALAVSALGAAMRHSLHRTAIWYLAAFGMVANFITWKVTSVAHLWSISVEEQFYVFWPSLMRRLSRRGLFIAGCAIVLLSEGALMYFGAKHRDTWKIVWYNSLSQAQYFGFGILLALHDDRMEWKKLPRMVRLLGMLAIGGVLFFTVAVLNIRKGPAQGPLSLALGYLLVGLCCVAFIRLVAGMRRWPRAVIYFGKVSYGLYVYHLLAVTLGRKLHGVPLLGQLLFSLCLTMLLAWLSYTYFESPFLRIKERYEIVKSRPVS